MKKTIIALCILCMFATACEFAPPTSDQIQQQSQETILKDLTAQSGMPAIKNGRERKIMKDILEMRDQSGLVTYSYLYSPYTGKFTPVCDSIGYPIPYATQYTNPQKIANEYREGGFAILPQADPNGLYSPASAEGTWVMCVDPATKKATVSYIEERLNVFTYQLPDSRLNK